MQLAMCLQPHPTRTLAAQVLPCGPFHQRCVLTLLRHHYQQHADQLAGLPAPVHRLGRGTSGVLFNRFQLLECT